MKIYNKNRIPRAARWHFRKPFQFRGLFEFADEETGETFVIRVGTFGGPDTPYELIEQYAQSLLITAGMLNAGATTIAELNGKPSPNYPADLPGPNADEPLLVEHDTSQDTYNEDQITFYGQIRA